MPILDLFVKDVVTIEPHESVLMAAGKMREYDVGAVVIMENKRHAIGILTDRDIVLHVVADEKAAATTAVSEIMTANPVCVDASSGLAEVIGKLEANKVRRAIVTDRDGLIRGIVSVDDLLALLGQELGALGRLVSGQVSREQISSTQGASGQPREDVRAFGD